MKKAIRRLILQTLLLLALYTVLLNALAGTNIVAGIFCPGDHLPHYYPILIGLFLFCRIGLLLLPGVILSRLTLAWMKK